VELAHNVLKDLGRVDVLVNSTDPHVQTPDMFVDVVTVNLFSNFWVSDIFIAGPSGRAV
jgi:NAD(P)-dependent dehydrogenase (short-subunit alcohol dehydrogenase family)